MRLRHHNVKTPTGFPNAKCSKAQQQHKVEERQLEEHHAMRSLIIEKEREGHKGNEHDDQERKEGDNR